MAGVCVGGWWWLCLKRSGENVKLSQKEEPEMKGGGEQSWRSEKGEGRRKMRGCQQLEMWSLRNHTERKSAGRRWGVKVKSSKFPREQV